MRPREPKSLQQLQDEMALTNQIMGRVRDDSSANARHYANPKNDKQENEHYYTNDMSFLRQENYTINGEPVNKYRGNQ